MLSAAPYQTKTVLPSNLAQLIDHGPWADMRWESQVRPATSPSTASAASRLPQATSSMSMTKPAVAETALASSTKPAAP